MIRNQRECPLNGKESSAWNGRSEKWELISHQETRDESLQGLKTYKKVYKQSILHLAKQSFKIKENWKKKTLQVNENYKNLLLGNHSSLQDTVMKKNS